MKSAMVNRRVQISTVAAFLLAAFCVLCSAGKAHAMHISEGILPLDWAALWYALSFFFIAYGLRKLKALSQGDLSVKPLVGLLAAIVFVISCMPVPVPTAGTCSHPGGTAIAAILVGPSISVLVAAVALLIQALFLAHGGLSTLGADIASMGVVGAFTGFAVFKLMRKCGAGLTLAAFSAGLLSDWAIYLTTSVQLAAGIRGDSAFVPLFIKIAVAFVPTQLPLGILEGVMTAGMVGLLARRRVDLLVKLGVLEREHAGGAV